MQCAERSTVPVPSTVAPLSSVIVQAEGQDQVAAFLPGHPHRQVVVDTLLELVQDREPVGGGEMDAGFG